MAQAIERIRENWFDDAYVDDWLGRQEARNSERLRQFAKIRSMIPRHPDESFRYLNIGAGDGRLDEVILAKFPRAEATLLDGSTRMLECAQERLRAFEGRVNYVAGDLQGNWAAQLSGTFGVAVSTIAIHNLREGSAIRRVYADLWSLVDEGGFFVNLDYVRAATPSLGPLAQWATADRIAWPLTRSRGGRGGAGTIEEQLVWLREAGFAPVDCFWREFQVAMFGGFRCMVHVPELPET